MGDQTNETVHFKIQKERTKAGDVLMRVYEAMSERGYDPVNQIVGYLISGDPTYITSYPLKLKSSKIKTRQKNEHYSKENSKTQNCKIRK